MNLCKSGKTIKAFTLIELLVVIAIIALLLSVVVPSLRMAKEVARRSICGSNLKSLGQGVFVYANSNNDLLPKSRYQAGEPGKGQPHYSYNLFTITSAPDLSAKQRVINTYGLGHLFMGDLIETGESYYCPSAPRIVEGSDEAAVSFRYEDYTKDGSDFPWNNEPSGWNTNLVRSGYNYVPQKYSQRVQITSASGSGSFPGDAKKSSELHASYALACDVLVDLNRLPHKKGNSQIAGGVNVLFSDGSVKFCNSREAFDEDLWRDKIINQDQYLFRTVLSRLQ
jgi:prepilin-type N-terminal cleavage/methylation domain-containing protein/prepilin-type processing-associated H-X9-DG protein